MFVEEKEPNPAGRPSEDGPTAEPDDLSRLPLEHLEHEIETLAAHINAGSCRWLELVAEFDRREGWGSWGIKSCADWISWRCAIAPRAAREHVRVARRLGELPLITDAFRSGELSYSKVRALTRVASPESQAELLHLARNATAAQLDRMVRGYRRVSAADAEAAHERAYLNFSWEEDGSLSFSGRLAPTDGALFLRALEAAGDALREERWQREREAAGTGERPESGSAEPLVGDPSGDTGESGSAEPLPSEREGAEERVSETPLPLPTHAEAFAAMAESALARGPSALAGGERYQVVIHADAESLTRDDPDSRSQIDDGPSIAAESARRAACDSSLVTVIERDGEPLNVGRRTRSIPPPLRRALSFRDRSCQFPGCERHRFTDAHHIRHWARGGETKLDNLVLLCRYHHRLVHEGGFELSRSADGKVTVRHPGGWLIAHQPRSRPSDPVRLAARNRAAGLSIDHETCASGIGERMDYPRCVEAVWWALNPDWVPEHLREAPG